MNFDGTLFRISTQDGSLTRTHNFTGLAIYGVRYSPDDKYVYLTGEMKEASNFFLVKFSFITREATWALKSTTTSLGFIA